MCKHELWCEVESRWAGELPSHDVVLGRRAVDVFERLVEQSLVFRLHPCGYWLWVRPSTLRDIPISVATLLAPEKPDRTFASDSISLVESEANEGHGVGLLLPLKGIGSMQFEDHCFHFMLTFDISHCSCRCLNSTSPTLGVLLTLVATKGSDVALRVLVRTFASFVIIRTQLCGSKFKQIVLTSNGDVCRKFSPDGACIC